MDARLGSWPKSTASVSQVPPESPGCKIAAGLHVRRGGRSAPSIMSAVISIRAQEIAPIGRESTMRKGHADGDTMTSGLRFFVLPHSSQAKGTINDVRMF